VSEERRHVYVEVSEFAAVRIDNDGYLGVTDEDQNGAGVFLSIEQARKVGQALLDFAADRATPL
jgi:hypothetical protein